jgi:hypothetical protein
MLNAQFVRHRIHGFQLRIFRVFVDSLFAECHLPAICFVHAAAGGTQFATGVIGVCSLYNSGSMKVTAPTPAPAPAPPPTPTVPYLTVTHYETPNCEGVVSSTYNFTIGACTAMPDSGRYGVASVTGMVRRVMTDVFAHTCWSVKLSFIGS